MHNLVQIDSDTALARDISSHAVITVSPDKVNEYRARKKIAETRASEMAQQQQQIDALKDDMVEIKSMLLALLQR